MTKERLRKASIFCLFVLSYLLGLCIILHGTEAQLLRRHAARATNQTCYVAYLGNGDFSRRMSGRLSLLLFTESHPSVFTYVHRAQDESPEEGVGFAHHPTDVRRTCTQVKWVPLEHQMRMISGEFKCKEDEIYYTTTEQMVWSSGTTMDRIRAVYQAKLNFPPNPRPVVVIHAHRGDTDGATLPSTYYVNAVRYHKEKLNNPQFIIETNHEVDMRPVVHEAGMANFQLIYSQPGDEFNQFLRCVFADGFIASQTKFSYAVRMLRDPCLPVVIPGEVVPHQPCYRTNHQM